MLAWAVLCTHMAAALHTASRAQIGPSLLSHPFTHHSVLRISGAPDAAPTLSGSSTWTYVAPHALQQAVVRIALNARDETLLATGSMRRRPDWTGSASLCVPFVQARSHRFHASRATLYLRVRRSAVRAPQLFVPWLAHIAVATQLQREPGALSGLVVLQSSGGPVHSAPTLTWRVAAAPRRTRMRVRFTGRHRIAAQQACGGTQLTTQLAGILLAATHLRASAAVRSSLFEVQPRASLTLHTRALGGQGRAWLRLSSDVVAWTPRLEVHGALAAERARMAVWLRWTPQPRTRATLALGGTLERRFYALALRLGATLQQRESSWRWQWRIEVST